MMVDFSVPPLLLDVVILAAGSSRRMCSHTSKVLHPLGGRPVLGYVLEQALSLHPSRILLVTSPALATDETLQALIPNNAHIIRQEKARGTGDAVRVALEEAREKDNHCPSLAETPHTLPHTLVLFGDTPLLSPQTLRALLDHHHTHNADLSLLGVRPPNPSGYGRLLIDQDTGKPVAICEEKEAPLHVLETQLCNGGVMLLGPRMRPLLKSLTPHNTAHEYYLTDLVALGVAQGLNITFQEAPFEEVAGINTRADLAQAELFLQQKWRKDALTLGVSLIDASSTYFSFDTQLSPDVTLYPHVFLGPGVTLESGVTVLPFSVLSDTTLKQGARVGPFCHLRCDTVIASQAVVGNFVEMKQTTLGHKTNVKHLTYLGDAVVGDQANIGAGTITCNYDGTHKHQTLIGERAFIGANTALVAPVSIGDHAQIGAGSVITQDVPPHTLAITRAPQQNRPRKQRS